MSDDKSETYTPSVKGEFTENSIFHVTTSGDNTFCEKSLAPGGPPSFLLSSQGCLPEFFGSLPISNETCSLREVKITPSMGNSETPILGADTLYGGNFVNSDQNPLHLLADVALSQSNQLCTSLSDPKPGTSSSLGSFKIPKRSTPPEDGVTGFTDDEYEDDEFVRYDDEDSDHSEYEVEKPRKKRAKRDAEQDDSSSDDDLVDGIFAVFNPTAKKKAKVSELNQKIIDKCYGDHIRAEDMDEKLEELDIMPAKCYNMNVKVLDTDLVEALPDSKFVERADKNYTAIEARLSRAARPALNLLSTLQEARNNKAKKLDISKLITMAEANLFTIGQAHLETRFQRRMVVASKILRDRKKAKKILMANSKLLNRENKYLFGQSFTARLVGKLKNTKKLRDSLKAVGLDRSRVRGRGRGAHRGSHHRSDTHRERQPFRGGSRGRGTRGGGRGRGGDAKRYVSCYVNTFSSNVKSVSVCKKVTRFRHGRKSTKNITSKVIIHSDPGGQNSKRSGVYSNKRSISPRGEDKSLHPKLAGPDSGPVDFGSSKGKKDSMDKLTLPTIRAETIDVQCRKKPGSVSRGTKNDRSQSNTGMSGMSTAVCKQPFSKAKKGRGGYDPS